MDATPNVQDAMRALDGTARREELLRDARGTWRVGLADIGSLLIAGLFFYFYAMHPDSTRDLVFAAGSLMIWRANRIETRLNAIVKFLEREV